MKTPARFTLAIAALSFLACQPADEAESAAAEPAMEAAGDVAMEGSTAELDALRSAWIDAALAHDAASLADLYAEDAVYMASTGKVTHGRADILAHFQEVVGGYEAIDVTPIKSWVTGNTSVDVGSFTSTYASPDGSMTVDGHYTVVSRHDGERWRIVSHIASVPNPEMAPQGDM